MALTISASSGAGSAQYYVKDKAGQVSLVEYDRDDINDTIEDGEKIVALTGYSDPFELTSEQYGTRTMVRLLYTVVDGDQRGERFSCLYGMSLGAKAKLREVVTAILARDLKPAEGVDFDEILNARLIVGTKSEVNAKGYGVVRHVMSRPAKKPAAKAAAAPAPDDLWGDDLP
jgi:hypothetical protein